jgi:hypothetical protein
MSRDVDRGVTRERVCRHGESLSAWSAPAQRRSLPYATVQERTEAPLDSYLLFRLVRTRHRRCEVPPKGYDNLAS